MWSSCGLDTIGLACVLDDGAKCRRKIASRRKVAGTIRYLGNTRSLQPGCAKMLHEGLLVPVLLYGSETII